MGCPSGRHAPSALPYVDPSKEYCVAPPADLREELQLTLGSAYVFKRELGGGGMARVFVARETALARDVVIKVLPPETTGAVSVDRFRREIQLAARLHHPHVVPVHSAGQARQLLYYSMPLVEGESLRQRLSRDGALPLTDAVRLLRDIADALCYAHEHGVVHRDLKPENILVSHRHALVTDFGVAKALTVAAGPDAETSDALTSVGVALGTPGYMAPEQVAADPQADHRVDLYALGIVAYEVLAGVHPFAGRTPQAMLAAQLTEVPTDLSERRHDVPRALAALVMRLLSKRPEDRPSSAEEALRELETLAPTAGSVRQPATAPSRARRAWLVAGGLAVLVLGVAVLTRQRQAPIRPAGATRGTDMPASGAAAKITSVAVLPLANVGGDTAQEYFADGMTDELTGALGRVSGLRVASRTSAYAFKARRDTDVREIGRRLNVDAILEGTLRRAGDRLRVSAQLTSTRDGLALWSGSYERRMADVFAVQDDIARSITSALEQRLAGRPLGVVEPTRQYDLEAYDLLLRAQFFFNKHTGESLRRSIGLYEAALARDSTLAPRAWYGINKSWTWLADDWEAPTTAWPKARTAGLNALAADSSFQPARAALGLVLLYFDRDFAGAERMIRAARAHDSTAGQYDLGDVLVVTGRAEESVAMMRQAQRLDPLDAQTSTGLGDRLSMAGHKDEALVQYRAALELDRDYPWAVLGAADVLLDEGRAADALQMLARSPEQTVAIRAATARAHAALGHRTDAERILHALEAESRHQYVAADQIAAIHAALGNHDAAFDWLDRAVTKRASGVLFLRVRRYWDPLRDDPRFGAIVRRVGLP